MQREIHVPVMTAASLITSSEYLWSCASLNYLNGGNSAYLRFVSYASLLMSFWTVAYLNAT